MSLSRPEEGRYAAVCTVVLDFRNLRHDTWRHQQVVWSSYGIGAHFMLLVVPPPPKKGLNKSLLIVRYVYLFTSSVTSCLLRKVWPYLMEGGGV